MPPFRSRRLGIVLLSIFFYILALFCLRQYSPEEAQISLADRLQYLPSGTFLKGAALSYDSELADLLWIKALTYFGDQYTTGHDYTWLYHMLDTVTTLDPYYQDPYEFGGIVLANEVGDVKKSILLLNKGMKYVPRKHPRYWYLPFFLGFDYWYFQKDYKKGAKYLEIAARFPQAPSYLPLLAARMYADASSAEMALPFLDEMIRSAKNPQRKSQLEKRRKEVLVNLHLDRLEKAITQYEKKFGGPPETLNELVVKGILKHIPEEPFGGKYIYDPVLRKVRSTHSKRIKVFKPKI